MQSIMDDVCTNCFYTQLKCYEFSYTWIFCPQIYDPSGDVRPGTVRSDMHHELGRSVAVSARGLGETCGISAVVFLLSLRVCISLFEWGVMIKLTGILSVHQQHDQLVDRDHVKLDRRWSSEEAN